tara:strand:+ start:12586 stop:14598 length:2013 start_codon:yes stop_codon:yes gene_type:complete
MATTSFQTGTITLTNLTASVTLGTTVAQGNSILSVKARGGSNTVGQYNVRVTLSSDGTTVTAARTTSGSTVIIGYEITEAPEFTVQHFEYSIAAIGTHDQAIISVDTDYAFPVCTGLSASGGSRSSDDFVSVRITSATNAQLEVGSASNITVAYQIVEMSASEIASVQEVPATLAAVTNNVTISSVDTGKSLIFASSWTTSAGGSIVNRQLPILSLTSSTNLRLESANNSAPSMTVYAYVVEFVNLTVTSSLTAGIVGTTTTEVLGAAPTYGGAIINGLIGRYGSANDTDDDSLEVMFTASLSGATWTFERGASTINADISYSVFDWADIFAAGSGIAGTLNATLGAITATAVGSIDTAAIFNQILSDVTAGGLASVDIDGFLDRQLDPLSAGGLAAVEVQGAADNILADLTLSASGNAVSGSSASLNVTLDGLAASGLAAVDIASLADIALDNLSSQSLGTVALQGAANITLADLRVDAQGAAVSGVSGSLDISLAPLISAALGTVSLAAVADIALDSASLEALGTVDITAALDIALAPLTLDGLGVLGSNISGSADMVLADVAASSQGLLAVAGELDAALASLASSGAGTVSITGLGDITLSSATLNAIGSALLPIEGTVAITLGEVTLASLAFTGLVVLASPVTLDIETQSVSIDIQCWDVGINFYN